MLQVKLSLTQFPNSLSCLYEFEFENESLEDLIAKNKPPFLTCAKNGERTLCVFLCYEPLGYLFIIGKSMNFRLPLEGIKKIEESTRDQSHNSNWMRFKKGRITALNIGVVMNLVSSH